MAQQPAGGASLEERRLTRLLGTGYFPAGTSSTLYNNQIRGTRVGFDDDLEGSRYPKILVELRALYHPPLRTGEAQAVGRKYSARRSTTCLSFIAQHTSGLHASKKKPQLPEIQAFIDRQIPSRAEAANAAEVAWLLFWARELRLTIDAIILARVVQLRSSICALLVLDLNQRNLISGTVDMSLWKSFANDDGPKSEMWLAAYEVTRKGWWDVSLPDAFITSHKFFADLAARDVEFYDPRRKSRAQVGAPFFSMLARMRALSAASDYPGYFAIPACP